MGDTGQVASKALPDPVRYSPPRLPNSNAASNGNHSHNDATANNTQTSNNRVSNPKANGHIGGPVPNGRISDAKPNGHTVDSKSNGHSDDHMGPFLPAPAKDARPSQPASHDTRAPPNHSDNHHKPSNNSNIPAPPPPPGRVEEKPGGRSQNLTNSKANQGKSSSLQQNDGHPRYYDDYELMKRRKQMESQGWPRDPKDYLIGGIYGPQPKSKPNESQQQQQSHHAAAPSHLDRRQGREPHRSKSFPRDARAPDDSLSRDRRPNNNRSNNNNSNLINNANKRAGGNPDRAFVLIDGHEGDAGRSRKSFGQGRGPNNRMDDFDDEGMATDYEHDVRRLYPKDGGSPTRNGPKQANRKPQDPLTKRRPTRPSIVEDAVVTSDIINNDGLNTYKARLVTFYKNGDLFFPGIKISLRPGRDFSSFEALCNYLTPRTDLPTGVRYIFTLGGRKVLSLDEFQDGGHYVCSSRKKFIPMNYTMGKRDEWKPHSKFATQQDMKLFRPPSQGTALGAKERRSPDAQPGSREGRVIRVINNEDHTIQHRILLNLRTGQPWEEVLRDLGHALRLPGASRLFTYSGQEVQSFSQLRNDFSEVDTFYLCTGESFGPRLQPVTSRSLDGKRSSQKKPKSLSRPGSAPEKQRHLDDDVREPPRGRGRSRAQPKSNSPPLNHVDPVRVKIRGQRREVYAPVNQRYQRDESPPDKTLELNWVYGYRGHDTRLNLTLLPTGELMYYVAAVVVLFDRVRNRQRHYTGHTEDIQCMALHPSKELCGTGQKEGKGRHSKAQVHIWDVETLSTQVVIGLNDVEIGVIALSFSLKNLGQHLLIVDDSPDHMIAIWNWKSKRLLSKAPIHQQKIIGGQFIPRDDAQAVTFGESHLTVWRRLKDGGFDRDDLLDDDVKTITCVEFDDDGDQFLITGDTDGNITLWDDSRSGVYQVVRVIQAHMRAVSAMLMLPDGTLLSSGGNEKDRYIKAWDSTHNYRAITFARLPESAGGIRSLCPSKLDSPEMGIFAGTSKNMVLEGSIHRRFKIIVQGHYRNLAALAVDPDEPAFVTAGYDKSISRWALHKLVWKVQVQSECTCLAIHPMGEVVTVGTTDGHFIVLTVHRGMHVATLPASKQVITCLAYNPDGSVLAVALEEGSLMLYSVSGRGYAYRRTRVLRGYDTIVQMDWSRDAKAIQSVTVDYNSILWDIISMEQEKIPSTLRDVRWHTVTCTLSYTVNGIWNNVNQMVDSVNTTCNCSASEKLLCSADDEGYIRLFRYPALTPRSDFHEVKAQSSKISTVRFLYDDSFVITVGGDDAVVMQWMVVHAK